MGVEIATEHCDAEDRDDQDPEAEEEQSGVG
jgi:hypothetical protein